MPPSTVSSTSRAASLPDEERIEEWKDRKSIPALKYLAQKVEQLKKETPVALQVSRAPSVRSPGRRGRLAGVLALLLAIAITAHPPLPCQGAGQHRNPAAKRAFKKANPCPGGPDRGSTRRCLGYVIDHICALACCGLDAPQNMQWQTLKESKAKDRWELRCENCGPVPSRD